MKVIIGSYRGPELVKRAIASLEEHLEGMTSLTIVDDSNPRQHPDWAPSYRSLEPKPYADSLHSYAATTVRADGSRGPRAIPVDVIQTYGKGYNAAMQAVCQASQRQRFMFWEEDFVLTAPVSLVHLERILTERPYLAQVALLRNPHFKIEKDLNGVLPALVARLGADKVQLRLHDGIIEQKGTFTCNPSVWQQNITAGGWPKGRWSEDRMRDILLAKGYRFGYLPGIRCHHDGVRSGHGY